MKTLASFLASFGVRRSRGFGTYAAVLALFLAGCGGLPQVPSKGGASWLEVTSEGFTLWTNAGQSAARTLLQRMEAQRQVLRKTIHKRDQHIFVIALSSARDYRVVFPDTSMARAWNEQTAVMQPMIVLSLDYADDEILNHELAHVLSFAQVRNQPRWLAEGLATYFESAVPDPQTGVAQLGLPSEGLRRFLTSSSRMPRMRTLFECQTSTCADPEFYAASWLLFSYLTNQHHKRFGIYLALIDRGIEPARAWQTVFPELSPEALDRGINWDLRKLKLPEVRVAVAQVPTKVRKLADADVLAVRALLRALSGDKESLREATAALSLAPTQLLASLIVAAHQAPLSAEHLRALTGAHPHDPRAWWLRSRLAKDRAEQQEAHARVCALAPAAFAECANAPQAPLK